MVYVTDCKDLLDHGHTDDGVYTINPDHTQPFEAFCDMTNGGWTVIQRRVDGSVDFYRGWEEYVAGFGDLCGNLWAGLDKIHTLTAEYDVELYVYMESFEDESRFAQYNSFSVGDASSGYRLKVSGYSGTAGDAMDYHDDLIFSTYDRDQDNYSSKNCAQEETGAWWLDSCRNTNPNGLYNQGITSRKGITWHQWKGEDYSLKTIEFKTRRLN